MNLTPFLRFPLISIGGWRQRKAAADMVAAIPELSARPMLLELVPDLIREKRSIGQLFGLYEFLVEKWLEREDHWIRKADLLEISTELAVITYIQQREGKGDRIAPFVLEKLAAEHKTPLESWKLRSRSLLNRDIEGQFKFAHRSVMEYLFLLAATTGDPRCNTVEWTDLMKDLLVSWGNSNIPDTAAAAKALLNLDHAATDLFPLASPLKIPQRRSLNDCRTLLKKDGISFRQSRVIPVAWRNQSLRVAPISSAGNVTAFEIYDSTHGICWIVNDISTAIEKTPYRDIFDAGSSSITTPLRYVDIRNAFRRLPSIEEMLSLWESEPYLIEQHPVSCIFDKDETYWLGDSGDAGPLCCSFGPTPLEASYLKLIASKIDGAGRGFHVHEFQNRYGLLHRQPFRSMSIHIAETITVAATTT